MDEVVERHMLDVISNKMVAHIVPMSKKLDANAKATKYLHRQVEERQKENSRNYDMIVASNMQHKKDIDTIREMLREMRFIVEEPDTKRTSTHAASTGPSGDETSYAQDGCAGNASGESQGPQAPARGRYYTPRLAPQEAEDEEVRAGLVCFPYKSHQENMLQSTSCWSPAMCTSTKAERCSTRSAMEGNDSASCSRPTMRLTCLWTHTEPTHTSTTWIESASACAPRLQPARPERERGGRPPTCR